MMDQLGALFNQDASMMLSLSDIRRMQLTVRFYPVHLIFAESIYAGRQCAVTMKLGRR